ncbi:MAG: ABC transporter substrate-binding protein [Jiangellaceae bacterium]
MAALMAAAATLIALSACGASDDETAPEASPPDGAFPVDVEDGIGIVTIEQQPVRIVSLSPTATETLFAIGAGEQVVAVDDQSDYPAGAPVTDLSGYEPNVEAIVAYKPDLVVLSDNSPSDLTEALDRLDIPVLAEPSATDFEQAYDQIQDLGAATGHVDQADKLVADMEQRIEGLIEGLPEGPALTVFHELGPDLYTASSGTFIGQVYELLGLENVADEAATQAGTDYPQVSPEYLLTADPDLVVLADGQCCGVTPEQVAARPGWEALSAVRGGAVVLVDEDVASRWGPRVPEFVEAAVEAIQLARDTSS